MISNKKTMEFIFPTKKDFCKIPRKKLDDKRCYIYLVKRKCDGKKFAMIGNLANPNVGLHKSLINFVPDHYPVGTESKFGKICNVSNGLVFSHKDYKIVAKTKYVRPEQE